MGLGDVGRRGQVGGLSPADGAQDVQVHAAGLGKSGQQQRQPGQGGQGIPGQHRGDAERDAGFVQAAQSG